MVLVPNLFPSSLGERVFVIPLTVWEYGRADAILLAEARFYLPREGTTLDLPESWREESTGCCDAAVAVFWLTTARFNLPWEGTPLDLPECCMGESGCCDATNKWCA